MKGIGVSGTIAKAFIRSKLTPLIVIAALLLGIFAVMVTPREEEPQIIVPMIDVYAAYPGASAKEVEERVTRPMERLLWEISGVEYVYSSSMPGMSLVIVRFKVGEDMEDSLVKLYNKLMSNYDRIPPGVTQPIVKPKSIDDVPILAMTLWGGEHTGYGLRRIAVELCDELKKDPDVSETTIIGGQRRQVRVLLKPDSMRAYGVSPLQLLRALQQSNARLPSGSFQKGNTEILLDAGRFLNGPEDVARVVVGVHQGRPVYLSSVATVVDGPEEPSNYVLMALVAGATAGSPDGQTQGLSEAVTLTVAKKKGTNASNISERLRAKVDALRGTILPSDVQVTVTRNYGETAKEKSDELLKHMMIATLSVIILIAFALGWRESVVVAVAVPVTLALTLLTSYLYGYTLNRVTLFALIFSIGILVDDAIVVVENIHRHFAMGKVEPIRAVLAVDEVGNPTILATLTVIAALLPMAFVTGLMGPYMRPIPVGASAAMIFSLLVAFIVSPWLSYKVLKGVRFSGHAGEAGRLHALYARILGPLIERRGLRVLALGGVALMLLVAVTLVPLKKVTVKMLPFDNKSEIQVIVDMPEGTTLEQTALVAREMGNFLVTVPETTDLQIYVGTAAPFNFNGLVRHYFLRQGANVADIQVNFVSKDERDAQSHDIAKRIRAPLQIIAERYGAAVKIAEIPPGPPVLSTLVAEVYGPDFGRQIEVAREIKSVFASTAGVVDVDWYVEDDQERFVFEVDQEKASLNGISSDVVARTLRVSLSGEEAGLIHSETEKEPVGILLRLPLADRSGMDTLRSLSIMAPSGKQVPLFELVKVKAVPADKTIYHKNLKRVVYVTGDVAGTEESPVYAILKMRDKVREMRLPEGYELAQYSSVQPWLEQKYSMKWDGEWQITYEVFRDLGIAFGAVLILIYILVVAWFRNFLTPIIIMAPIPLTLVGILPGHWLFGAFFTATSMIGFIALAGIIVRNSILLIDFVQMEWSETGDLEGALVKAGAVRFRPIALTAAAVVVGSFVMLFDPIFQGLAIAMMFGAVAATALTLVAVPLLYFEAFRRKAAPPGKGSPEEVEGGEDVGGAS